MQRQDPRWQISFALRYSQVDEYIQLSEFWHSGATAGKFLLALPWHTAVENQERFLAGRLAVPPSNPSPHRVSSKTKTTCLQEMKEQTQHSSLLMHFEQQKFVRLSLQPGRLETSITNENKRLTFVHTDGQNWEQSNSGHAGRIPDSSASFSLLVWFCHQQKGLLEDKLPANPQTPRHIVPLQILAGVLLTKSKCEIQWQWLSTLED